ncbi:DUF2848 domain-containing protein [Paenochrobactrum sp. BZR 201-1]
MTMLQMAVVSQDGRQDIEIEVKNLIIAGWAGRNKQAMEEHIKELEELGVARPASTPTYYRVAAARLTTAPIIEDTGTAGSGEVESVIFAHHGKLYVGLASDHTEREVETYGVTVSKQMCDKPVASTVWPFDEVKDHWDEMILRSFATIDGVRVLYQEGSISGLLAPLDLIAGYSDAGKLADGTAMLGGTMPAIGGIRAATRFEGELEDPVLKRKISFSYDVLTLPVLG